MGWCAYSNVPGWLGVAEGSQDQPPGRGGSMGLNCRVAQPHSPRQPPTLLLSLLHPGEGWKYGTVLYIWLGFRYFDWGIKNIELSRERKSKNYFFCTTPQPPHLHTPPPFPRAPRVIQGKGPLPPSTLPSSTPQDLIPTLPQLPVIKDKTQCKYTGHPSF